MSEPRSRLYLVTPPIGAAADLLAEIEAALGAGDVACLLLRLRPAAERDLKQIVKAVAAAVQERGTALLVEDPRIAVHSGADGVHVAGAGEALSAALESLKPDRIVGIGCTRSRDEAMQAGEAGVDYVMFGDAGFSGPGPDHDEIVDAVGWWAEIFNVPCVGFVRRLDEVEAMAEAGAEFVGLADAVWADARGAAAAVAEAGAAIRRAEATLALAESAAVGSGS